MGGEYGHLACPLVSAPRRHDGLFGTDSVKFRGAFSFEIVRAAGLDGTVLLVAGMETDREEDILCWFCKYFHSW